MGIRHKTLPIEGVQFHPESIASGRADEFFKAFLNYRREPLDIRGILNTLTAGKDLSRETAEMFMEDLTDGIMDERQMAAILTALSSKSGAADFYTAAGFKLDMTPEKAASVIDKTNFVFLMAPVYHSAMRFAGPRIRKELDSAERFHDYRLVR